MNGTGQQADPAMHGCAPQPGTSAAMLTTLIAAVGQDGCIGKGGVLPWRLPADMRRFKALTLSKPVIMGRRTWDSLPRRPLPGRLNIVVSRQMPCGGAPGATVVRSLEEALHAAESTGAAEAAVIGGGEIYSLAMPLADRLLLTCVAADVPDGDAWFPEVDPTLWDTTSTQPAPDPEPAATYVTLERRRSP